jgi:hypothetical protein
VRARVVDLHRAGSPVLLLVDEAHALPGETREQFRLLAQHDAGGERMRIVLLRPDELDHDLALPAIARLSAGIPRRIDVVADTALLSAAMERRHAVGARDVAAAADEIKRSRRRRTRSRRLPAVVAFPAAGRIGFRAAGRVARRLPFRPAGRIADRNRARAPRSRRPVGYNHGLPARRAGARRPSRGRATAHASRPRWMPNASTRPSR